MRRSPGEAFDRSTVVCPAIGVPIDVHEERRDSNMKRHTSFAVVAIVVGFLLPTSALAQVQCSQTLPNGYMNVDGPTFLGNPFNSTSAQKWQWVYDSSHFLAQGPITITDIAVRPTSPTVTAAATTFSSFKVRLGSSPNNYTLASQSATFANNLTTNQVLAYNGVWSTGVITASAGTTANWIQFGLTTPFTFNPGLGQDLVVQVEKCSSASAQFQLDAISGASGTVGGNSYGNTSACTAASRSTSYNETCPIIKVDYSQNLTPNWQLNSPQCDMNINGVQNSACSGGPIAVNICPGQSGTVNLSTSLTFPPFDLLVTLGQPVPLGGGGFTTTHGQIVNMNLADPTLFLLNGGAFQPLPSFSLPVTLAAVGGFSAQMIVLDATHPDSFRLSAANRLAAVAPFVAGPVGDDTYVSVVTGGPAVCGPASFTYYGVAYTTVNVQSNGRLMWGGAGITNDITPSNTLALTQNPAAGAWVDLSPPAGGLITINSPGPGLLRASWSSVPYFNQQALVTNWYIELDATTGAITISGLANFPVHPTAANMWLGVSAGQFGPATDGGAITYALGGPTAGPPGLLDMVYAYGPTGTLTPGINTLIFTPNGLGNYNYTALP